MNEDFPIDPYIPLIFMDWVTVEPRDKVMGMRLFQFKEIENWLVGIHLNATNDKDARMSGEAVDLIKAMRKALNYSHDMRKVYDTACAEERERIAKELMK